jgi:putative ATPase
MRSLFDQFSHPEREPGPLASRMRPRTFQSFVGQEHIVGNGTVLRENIQNGQLPSLIIWGPSGTGKTTLARIIADYCEAHFESITGFNAGVADIRNIVDIAQKVKRLEGKKTVLFVDEIHRFSKSQQDVLLPHVESGTVSLIGATTENPSVTVIRPLLSRCLVLKTEGLDGQALLQLMQSALVDSVNGLAEWNPTIDKAALEYIVRMADGDARVALNTLELATIATAAGGDGVRRITLNTIERTLDERYIPHDRDGDYHYDTISALIKSVRGSDPDAAIYWLARMLAGGTDPLYVTRRLMVLAAEDIGLANEAALSLAVSAHHAVTAIGLPEAAIPLAEAVIGLAVSAKSNAVYTALRAAQEEVQKTRGKQVPIHLRNPSNATRRDLGHGSDYRYPHDFADHFVVQRYLPDGLAQTQFYFPSDQGREGHVRERLEHLNDTRENK